MNEIVVDASVALCWFAREEQTSNANRLIAAAVDLVAPSLMLIELANGLLKKIRRGEISVDDAEVGIREVWRFVPHIVDAADLARPAMMLARELDHPVYDCVYLALARRRGARFITLDRVFTTRVAGTRYRSDTMLLADWT